MVLFYTIFTFVLIDRSTSFSTSNPQPQRAPLPSLPPNPLSASKNVILIEQDLLSEQIHAYTSNAYTSSSLSVKNRGPRNCLSFDEVKLN